MLDDAKKLLSWMREEGITSARVGDVMLTLGEREAPLVPRSAYDDEPPEKAPRPRPTSPEDDPMTFDGKDVPGFEYAKDPVYPND